MRLGSQEWEAFATDESKTAMVLWMAGGLAYQWWAGHLVSLSTVLLFFPGIFVASLAAIPTALVNRLKVDQLSAMKQGRRPHSTILLSPQDRPCGSRCRRTSNA